ncbi:MAG: hypothetical protein HRU30_10325, partial [Rhodobacteraceae bacterium]|nr:hypothetical protein [Paracoccaceae bacterium]
MNFQFQILTGYAYGALQPGVILKARHVPDAANQLSENLAVFLENLPPPEQDVVSVHTDAGLDDDHLLVRLVEAVHLVGLECGDLRLTPILWTRVDDAVQVYVPTLSPKLIIWAFKTIVENLEARSDPMTANIQAEFMDQIMQKSLRLLPSGTNARSLIDSAAARRMPFYIFDRKHIVFGYGAGSHVMSSSITDRESGIGVTLAKSKAATNRYLRLSEFPVTKQAMVRSFEDVKLFAETNGFPIVLKPTAEEQGRGGT